MQILFQQRVTATWLLTGFALGCLACRAPRSHAESLIVVNAPANGTIRRLLISEGGAVNAGAEIIELALPAVPAATNQPPASAPPTAENLRGEIATAQENVERAAI